MIINIRGTSGSGKSTIVKKLMALYNTREPQMLNGRRHPISYHCELPNHVLVAIGHYESNSGGCDSLPDLDTAFNLIKVAYACKMDSVFEGVMVSGEYKRCLELYKSGYPIHVIRLTTPLQVCLDAIQQRRAAKGTTSEFNPARTIRRDGEVTRMTRRLQESGVPTYFLDRDAAVTKCRELLNV
jgi:energy-coupling factor transporter ATP-binding protein EcfA2